MTLKVQTKKPSRLGLGFGSRVLSPGQDARSIFHRDNLQCLALFWRDGFAEQLQQPVDGAAALGAELPSLEVDRGDHVQVAVKTRGAHTQGVTGGVWQFDQCRLNIGLHQRK
ncbi:hypothetical protein Bpro_5403 (plasmid) [Polaromonas sp. JS666]|nr:hypothetical protein Bpro_5403 [Polaromonas sp. JS666]